MMSTQETNSICATCKHFRANQALPEHFRDKLKKSPGAIRGALNSRAKGAFEELARGVHPINRWSNLCSIAIVHEALCADGAIVAPITKCEYHQSGEGAR